MQGHGLVLPPLLPEEFVPLIVVGRGKTLQLRNVKVRDSQDMNLPGHEYPQ